MNTGNHAKNANLKNNRIFGRIEKWAIKETKDIVEIEEEEIISLKEIIGGEIIEAVLTHKEIEIIFVLL